MVPVLWVMACILAATFIAMSVHPNKRQVERNKRLADLWSAVADRLDRVTELMEEQGKLWEQLLSNARQRMH